MRGEAKKVSVEKQVVDGKNKKQLVCSKCSSKVLQPRIGTYEEIEFDLPVMFKLREKDKDGNDQDVTIDRFEKERLTQFFRVDDMFDFDNAGFSHTVENRKFLSCADCEVGPIGLHDMTTKMSYVALARVNFKD